MTQRQLGRLAGLSPQTICAWELGGRPQWMRQVRAVARALAVPAGWLMFGGRPVVPEPIPCPLCGGSGALTRPGRSSRR